MSARAIAGIIALSIATTGAILANMFLYVMIGEINRKRQDANQISYFGFAYPKIRRIFREYRRLYPDGKANIYSLAAFAVAVIGLGFIMVGILTYPPTG